MIEVAKPGEQRALIALCGLCGLRVSETLATRPSGFDFDRLDLTVRGKGDVTRTVPVMEQAWEAMFDSVTRAFLTGQNPLVISFKDRFARSLITALGERAGLDRRVASHDLRATFATEVYNRTLDQRVVQLLLGHASGSTTELYIGVTRDKMRDAVGRLTR